MITSLGVSFTSLVEEVAKGELTLLPFLGDDLHVRNGLKKKNCLSIQVEFFSLKKCFKFKVFKIKKS